MKNQNTKSEQTILAEITGIYLVEKVSKKGNTYKCIIAVDENDKEHFVCYAK